MNGLRDRRDRPELVVAAMSDLSRAKARLREGTEILRTGGGVHLTATDCNALLDELERLSDGRNEDGTFGPKHATSEGIELRPDG